MNIAFVRSVCINQSDSSSFSQTWSQCKACTADRPRMQWRRQAGAEYKSINRSIINYHQQQQYLDCPAALRYRTLEGVGTFYAPAHNNARPTEIVSVRQVAGRCSSIHDLIGHEAVTSWRARCEVWLSVAIGLAASRCPIIQSVSYTHLTLPTILRV